MDIKVALKNALGTIQTPTTAANYQATDLVPLFDSNDQLIGKISRNELMSAVKTSLGTLLNQGAADLGTSLAKIPALNSGGTLGSATVANLASVLGVGLPLKRIAVSSASFDYDARYEGYVSIQSKNGQQMIPIAFVSTNRNGWFFSVSNEPSSYVIKIDGSSPSGTYNGYLYYI